MYFDKLRQSGCFCRKFRKVFVIELDQCPHDSPALMGNKITSGSGNLFNQSVIAQFLYEAACFGTPLLLILLPREHDFTDVPITETIDDILPVADGFHDTDYTRRPDIKARYPFPVYSCSIANLTNFIKHGFCWHNIRHGVEQPLIA